MESRQESEEWQGGSRGRRTQDTGCCEQPRQDQRSHEEREGAAEDRTDTAYCRPKAEAGREQAEEVPWTQDVTFNTFADYDNLYYRRETLGSQRHCPHC